MNTVRFTVLAVLFIGICGFFAEESEAEVDLLWNHTISGNAHSTDISDDGTYIIASDGEGSINLFHKDNSTPLWNYTADNGVNSVAISADGQYITAGDYDGIIYLFHRDSNEPLWTYIIESNSYSGVEAVDISADGEYITAGSWDNKVYLFDQAGNYLWSYDTLTDGTEFFFSWVLSVSISDDGEYITAGSMNSRVYLFDKDNNGIPMWKYTTSGSIITVDISADGEYIAAGSADDSLYLFDQAGNNLWSYAATDFVISVDISDDSEYVAAGSQDNTLYFFHRDSNQTLWTYTAPETIQSVATSENGDYIVAGSIDDFVYLFEKESGEPFWFYDTENNVFSVSISADSSYIVAGNLDSNVFLFVHNDYPSATIDSIAPSPATYGDTISFSGTGSDTDGSIVAYEWNSSVDGFLSDLEDFSFTNLTVGNHNISFRVQDDKGAWSNWSIVELIVNPNEIPVASIDSISPSPARFDDYISFSGTGTDNDGTIAEYEWKSSLIGTMSNLEDFEVSGLTSGTHTISFRVLDNDGDWSEWNTTELLVNPNEPPVAIIDLISPSPAETGTAVYFSGTGLDDDIIVLYQWISSRDGELSMDEDFSSSSLSVGNHNIIFRVQDSNGVWADDQAQLQIHATPVAIAGDNVTVEVGDSLQFNSQGTDEDGDIVGYEWDFDGDGVYDWSSPDPVDGTNDATHIYEFEGTYTAILRVTDNDGYTATDSRTITVNRVPDPEEEGFASNLSPYIVFSVLLVLVAVSVLLVARRR